MNGTPRTLIEFLNAAKDYLSAKGVQNPRSDAEALLGKALKLPRLQIFLQHDRPLNPDEISIYRDLIARRGKREPLQLILGCVEFHGVQIIVSPGLLIPRPETEELAEVVIQWAAARRSNVLRVLDVGTGTGCLAVAVAARTSNAVVDAVDIDVEAVRCATGNAERNNAADRVHVYSADFLSPGFLDIVRPPYDIIMSNPPYVAEKDYLSLAPEVKQFESKHALIAGEDGLMFYRRMAELIPSLLRSDGILAVEVGYNQAEYVAELFSRVLCDIAVMKDLSGVPRIVSGRMMANEPLVLSAV